MMNKFVFILACLLTMYSSSAFILDSRDAQIVDTDCGRISGVRNDTDGAFVFKGIPYASPPVNVLRWKSPVPLAHSNGNCWHGTLDASRFGESCAQMDLYNKQISGAEDCLFLNVWTPTLNPSAKLPVMVFIHGGYLLTGSGSQQDIGYAPTTQLAVETNMVHVSFNYRLNAFGFMALEWLANESGTNTSGNYGLMDQIEVLRWVQRNIGRFGGDKNQVTVYGQSSGGTSIFALLASPLCHGLFHRAWLLSGSPILNKTKDDAFSDNLVFVQRSGCQDVQCLYSLSMEQVLNSVPWDVYPYWLMDDLLGLPHKNRFDGALPIIDGYVLKYTPFDAWTQGLGVDVPVLVGTTAQEADLILEPVAAQNWTWAGQTYENHVRSALTPFGDLVANMALTLYPVNTSTPQYQLSSMITDARVGCGTDYLTQIAAASFQSPVYRYVATFTPPQPVNSFGIQFPQRYAFHGIDIFAFFGTLDMLGYKLSAHDENWKTTMQREVTHFVKTGNPASATWHSYPETTALLSETTTMSSGYHRAECQFWLTNGFYSYSWIN